jgi:DNA-binding winged helix-turn-helix (wHTH) protein
MDCSSPKPAATKPVRYHFADFRLEADGTLLRGVTPLLLPVHELALLRTLLARQGEVVSVGELSGALYGLTHMSEDRVAACVASLEKHLQPADCIESVHRRGYRIHAKAEFDREAVGQPRSLLAILPFANGYDVPEYLGPAIAEQAANQLRAKRPVLVKIAAQESVSALARRGLSISELGAMLSADLVLTGQLLATPGRLRLRVEMIRVEDGAPLWVEDMIAEREQFAKLASELVNRVTARLNCSAIHLRAEADSDATLEALPGSTAPAQREARDLYLRAHHEWQNMERHRMQDAMGRLLRVIELDPGLIAARVDLAQVAVVQCVYGYLSPRIAAATVRRATQAIPELNQQAEALLPALGWIEFHFDREARSALQMMARSTGLNYDSVDTRTRAWLLLSRHRFGEAVEILRTALQLDPWSPFLQSLLAWALHMSGDRDGSVAQAKKAVSSFSDYDNGYLYAAMILAYNGETASAIELAETLTARSSHYDLAISAHAYALACAGRIEEARDRLERLQWLSRERFVLTTLNAATYVVLGESDAALEELRAANESRCPWFFQMLADPRLKLLHARPEFAALEAVHAAMKAGATSPS